jgi:hypothetical protein
MGGSKPATSSTKSATSSTPAVTKASIQSDMNRGRTIGIFIAGVVVGALVVWAWNAGNTTSTSNSNAANTGAVGETTNNTSNTGVIGGTGSTNTTGSTNPSHTGSTGSNTASTNNIVVPSQAAGMKVTISDAHVQAPTWLVVYELYQGKPVRALGATMFFPQYNGKGGVISLQRATKPNTTYFIGQSLDSGNHTFTPHVNKEILDSSGKMVGVTFTTK